MLDPVSSVIANRSGPLAQSASSLRERIKDGKESAVTQRPDVQRAKESDKVSVSFNLNDLQGLSQSVSVVQAQVREQLEVRFGIRKANEEEAESKTDEFQPPENASVNDILDFYSPQNTAERIVGFATSFFDVYAANHSKSTDEENINGFSNLIGNAIQKGFKEAEKILGDFEKLENIGKNIKETYNHVMKGLEEFRLEHFNDLGLQPQKPEIVSE